MTDIDNKNREPLYLAAINCPHEIDHNRVVLHYDGTQPGHNALAQLGDRLAKAAQQATPGFALVPPYDGLLSEFVDEVARLCNDAPGSRDAIYGALQSCNAVIVPAASPSPDREQVGEALGLSYQSCALLLNVLWHHQGGSSTVGQPIRTMLGIGQYDHLTEEQLSEAKRIEGMLAWHEAPDALPFRERGQTEAQIMHVAADACMSPNQRNLLDKIGENDPDVYARLFRGVVARTTPAITADQVRAARDYLKHLTTIEITDSAMGAVLEAACFPVSAGVWIWQECTPTHPGKVLVGATLTEDGRLVGGHWEDAEQPRECGERQGYSKEWCMRMAALEPDDGVPPAGIAASAPTLGDEEWPSDRDAAIQACALMILGICKTEPHEVWPKRIEGRIRYMLSKLQPQAAEPKGQEEQPSFTNPLTPYGMLVRALRIVTGTTLYDMAKALLTTPAKLSSMEFGRAPVTQEFAFDVAAYFDALGVPDTLAALKVAANTRALLSEGE